MSGSMSLLVGLAAIGIAIGILFIALFAPKKQQRGVAGALMAIDTHYGQHSARAARTVDTTRQAALPPWAKTLALRLSPAGVAATLQRRLDLAGNAPGWTADRVLALKGIALILGAAIGVLLGIHNVALALLWAGAGGAAGFFLPDLLLYNAGMKRQDTILKSLPDAMDMLTICVEAGLGFDAALAQVARNTTGPLAEEFARTLQEMQIGLSRIEALRKMVARTSVTDLRAFVSALVQASELGIPVARVLREQSVEMRVRRRQRAEEIAQKIPVKIMFPVVICLFPALLIIIVGPGIIAIAHTLFGL